MDVRRVQHKQEVAYMGSKKMSESVMIVGNVHIMIWEPYSYIYARVRFLNRKGVSQWSIAYQECELYTNKSACIIQY